MKLLFIEDDDNKIKVIKEFLEKEFSSFTIEIAKSYNNGLRKIFDNNYDLLLLDMSMPVFDKSTSEFGNDFLKFAGADILREMEFNNIFIKTLIITQYDNFGNKTLFELKEELKNNYPDIYYDTIYYNASESRWKEELKNLIITYINDIDTYSR